MTKTQLLQVESVPPHLPGHETMAGFGIKRRVDPPDTSPAAASAASAAPQLTVAAEMFARPKQSVHQWGFPSQLGALSRTRRG